MGTHKLPFKKVERLGKAKLPGWWTDLAFPKLEAAKYADVAKRASILAGRKSAWTPSAISRFVSGEATTRELANAISSVFEIPQPYFEARSAAESKAIKGIMDMNPAEPNPEQEAKLRALDQAGEVERRFAIDQTDPLQSKDERTSGRRRAGRITRRRS